MIAGIMEWDMKPRAEAIVPPESKITILENTTFSIDGHYWAIPKGVPQNEIDIILDLMKFMLQPEQQALTWRAFIGPVNKSGHARQRAAGHPRLREGVLASRIRRDGQEVQDRADARSAQAQLRLRSLGQGSGCAEDQAPVNQTLQSLRFRLTKRFGSKTVLDDFALEVQGRQFVTLLGPSGCGKSTALNIVAGLIPASEGELWIDGERVDDVPAEQRGFGMVFQNYALFPHMTVFGNVAFGLELQRRPAAEVKERVRAMLQLVRLPEFEDRYPSQLSGGQQQRVAIARALVLHPRLLLLDEPLSNLDAKLRVEMRAEIKRIHASLGLTCVYVTHDQIEALSLSDWVVVMRDGVVMQAGPPNEIYNRPANVFVADFMGFRNFFRGEIRQRWAAAARQGRDREPRQHAQAGPPATAAIRPEDVEIGGNGGGRQTSSAAGSRSSSTLGATTKRCCGLRTSRPYGSHTKAHLAPGDVVSVTFPPDKVILLPDAPGAPA